MKIKRLRKISINSFDFKVKWSKLHDGGSFCYGERVIEIGIRNAQEETIFMVLCHELMEIAAAECCVRMQRPDCNNDYIFVYDHRQYEVMVNMFASWIKQFID